MDQRILRATRLAEIDATLTYDDFLMDGARQVLEMEKQQIIDECSKEEK